MKITLEVGDYSHDGHNQSDTFTLDSNINVFKLKEAYAKGTEIIQFDLIKDVAEEYEDCFLGKIEYDLLKKVGYIFDEDLWDEWNANQFLKSEKLHIYTECFTNMFLFICRLGNPNFEGRIVKNEQWMNIGGYGLFS